ncbi:hypothetical protein HH196_10775 [Marinobacterium sp. LSUCC0821]|nr:hypothetical protein HH196_10775 [Marinobacterium sp. LSUCC0821]
MEERPDISQRELASRLGVSVENYKST